MMLGAAVYPCGNVQALAEAVHGLERDQDLYRRYSAASRGIAPSQDSSFAANAALRALAGLYPGFAPQWAEVDKAHFERWNRLGAQPSRGGLPAQ